jgi:hypothetical protein
MAIIDTKRLSTKMKHFIFGIKYGYSSLIAKLHTEHLLQVKLNKRPVVSVDFVSIYSVTICDVNCLISKIIDNCLQATTGEAWEELSHSKFSGDVSIIGIKKLTLNN